VKNVKIRINYFNQILKIRILRNKRWKEGKNNEAIQYKKNINKTDIHIDTDEGSLSALRNKMEYHTDGIF
jgi:hypothetical protein